MGRTVELRRTPNNELYQYLPRWLDNTDIDNMGVFNFLYDMWEINRQLGYPPLIKDFFPQYGAPPWAREALYEYYTWEEKMTKEDRCFAWATFREGTKTFHASFLMPLYEILVGQYGMFFDGHMLPEMDYQVFQNKNAGEAKKRLMNISSFLNHPLVHRLFGDLKPGFKHIKQKEAKDSGELLILTNKYIIQGLGIMQPTRGLNLFQMRPKKIVYDDVQNNENTVTPERRSKCDKDVMEESFGAVANEGSILYIGNKIHEDDTIGKLLSEENTKWKKKFFTLTVRKDPDGSIHPGVGDLDNEIPAWSGRDTIEAIKKKKDWFEAQPKLGGLRGFLKEYYNIIKNDANYFIKYHEALYLHAFGLNWLVFIKPDGTKEYLNVHIVVSNDPAISTRKDSSNSVISAVAFDAFHRRFILEQRIGKFDIHDRYADGRKRVLPKTPDDIANLTRRGNVELVCEAVQRYHCNDVVIETFGQQGTFFNEVVSKLNEELFLFPTVMPYTSAMPKIDRDKECPLAYFENGLYYMRPEMGMLRVEVDTFPHSKLDCLDSLHLAEQLAQFPISVPYNPLGVQIGQDQPINDVKESFSQSSGLVNDYEAWICL